MDTTIETLHELCETVSRELEECNKKIRNAGGKMSAGDADYLDKLTHILKSIKTTIAMMEADEGYSGEYRPRYGTYHDPRNNMSYARKRDSMGRYSRRGYSYADNMDGLLDEIREMLPELPDEKRRKAEKLMDELTH